jgi:mutator protein MutT
MSAERIRVAIALIFDQGHEHVLITQRKADAVLGGYWEFPGGKCLPGETSAACCTREVMEEVGLQVAAAGALPTVDYDYPHAAIRLCPLLCHASAGEARPLAVQQLRWVRPGELAAYRFPEANAALVELAGRGYEALAEAARDF